MHDLIITTIQADLVWENIEVNLTNFDAQLEGLTQSDIIVLPEMFTTGFTMNTIKHATNMKGKDIQWMIAKAKQTNAVIIGSLIIKEQNNYYNRLIVAKPNGELLHYDKRHLFRMANEHQHFSSGSNKLIFEYKGWNIFPLICYDLRFPVWSRNDSTIDLYIYVANWPKARISAWTKLLYARAIENLAYVIGVNRIGVDGKDISYAGGSKIIDYKGDIINEHPDNMISTITSILSKKTLTDFRLKFAAHLDADNFEIK